MLARLHKRWRPQRVQRRWRFMFDKLSPRAVTSVIKRKYPDVNTKQVQRELNRILKSVKKFHAYPALPTAAQRAANQKSKPTKKRKKSTCMTLEKAIAAGRSRWNDQKYYVTRVIYERRQLTNPVPTEQDKAEKCRIFKIPNLNTCCVTHLSSNGAGDHLFEINGYAKATEETYGVALHGRYDWWNTVPIVGSINKSYKKFPILGKKPKDIGWQTLTKQEYAMQSVERRRLYDMIQEWKRYCASSGAALSFMFNAEDIAFFDSRKALYDKLWDI